MAEAPIAHDSSSNPSNLQITSALPSEVVQCLQNARFLHLATCTSLHPHVSLMNYTYLPSSPYFPAPQIIMTTPPSSRKTSNLLSNPHVSLLVHDWVSHRPPTTSSTRNGSPPPEVGGGRSSLATLLQGLNRGAISSISATINGEARLVERGTEEESWLRRRHLENNTFGDGGEGGGTGEGGFWGGEDGNGEGGDGGRGIFIEGEEVRVVVVEIRDGRVADWKGAVRDWVLRPEAEGNGERLVNGA